MKHAKVILGCLVMAVLAACVPVGPASPQAPSGTPTIDLATSSVEFELEIKGDPHPLSAVRGLAVDQQGNLYVVDCESNRIQKLDSEGKFITAWGSEGSGDGEFLLWFIRDASRRPVGDVAVDAQGHVYVADSGNSRIQVFDSEGQFLAKWGEEGMGDGQFYTPLGVAVGPEGDVYVTDTSRGDVQRFDSRGQFLGKWSLPDMGGEFVTTPAVDADGNIYVPIWLAKEVRKFDGEGKLLATIGEEGNGDGQFHKPVAVTVDRQGNVYVADAITHCVQKFDSEGDFLRRWGSKGAGEGEFRSPSGLAAAADGSIYVADFGNKRVQKFRQQ
jgi:tripartite motif-containing protein 71